MAEKNLDYNNVSHNKALEFFLTSYLKQVEYKSDLIILLAHYILTQSLNYKCVVCNSDEKVKYEVIDELPLDWNRLSGHYKLTYKKDETIKILSGLKKNDSFVLHVLKENRDKIFSGSKKKDSNMFEVLNLNHDRDQMSISLKRYIPDEFFVINHAQYKSLQSLQVRDIMNIITKIVFGKFELKNILDSDVRKTNTDLQEILINKDEKVTPNIRNDLDDDLNGPLYTIPKYKPDKKKKVKGEFSLQDPDKPKPKDENLDVDLRYYEHPNFVMQEDLDGEPTSSIYS